MPPKKTSTTPKGQTSKGKAKEREYESSDDYGTDEEYAPEGEDVQDTTQKKRKVAQQNILQKFYNAEAQTKFCDFAIRPIHIERATVITEKHYIDIIKHYNWQKLTEAPDSCIVAIAKEFYANAAGANEKEVLSKGVFIRGKYIKLTPQLVNKHYGLKDYAPDQFDDLKNAGDLDIILGELSLPGIDWVRSRHGHPRFVELKDLTAEAKTWLLFINSRLMPTTHTTRISTNRICLVYAIKNKLTVDVGQLIIRYIGHAIADEHQALYFPLLLCEQAVKAGVKLNAGEESRNPAMPIKDGQIKQYRALEKADRERLEEEARERDREAQEQMDNIDEDQAAPAQPQPTRQPPQPLGNFNHMQHALEGMQTAMQNQQNALTQHMENMEGRWTGMETCMGLIGTRIDSMSQEHTTQWTTLDNKITQCQTEVHNLNLMMVHHHQTRGPDSYFPPLEEMESHSRMIVDTSSTTRVVMQQGMSSNAGSASPNFRPAQPQFPGFSRFSGQPPPPDA